MSEPAQHHRRHRADVDEPLEGEDAAAVDETDEDRPPPIRVATRRDELGRPVDVVEVTDPAAAVEWDERAWRRGPVR